MPVLTGREDLRSIKTEKSLNIALASLMGKRNFGKITVRDICDEALICRSTFYAHFTDKYDLLKDWLGNLSSENANQDSSYEHIEKTVNQFVHENETIITNLISDADNGTLGVLSNALLSALGVTSDENESGKTDLKHIVLSNFYVGGIVFYFLWLVRNKFPSDAAPMNIYLYDIIAMLQEWSRINKQQGGDEQ